MARLPQLGSGPVPSVVDRAPAPSRSLDEAWFREFYAQTADRVFSFLYHRCGGSAKQARDLLQETYVAVVCAVRGGSVMTPTPAWVMTIARNKLVDHVRRSTREMRHLRSVALESPRDQASAAGDLEVTRDEVLAVVWALPAHQRLLLSLRHLDGLSVPEVADHIGRSVAATESNLSRARAAFRLRREEVRRA